MPDVPGPEDVPSLESRLGEFDSPQARRALAKRPIDLRHVEGPVHLVPDPERNARQHVWMRAVAPLPDDPRTQAAWLAYASDFSLLESIIRRHGVAWTTPGLRSASLDHAMWFHRPARVDDWLLYVQESPFAGGARGLGLGRIYTRDGTLVASVAQEGMVRLPADGIPR